MLNDAAIERYTSRSEFCEPSEHVTAREIQLLRRTLAEANHASGDQLFLVQAVLQPRSNSEPARYLWSVWTNGGELVLDFLTIDRARLAMAAIKNAAPAIQQRCGN